MAEQSVAIAGEGGTEQYTCVNRSFSTHAYDVRRGTSGLHRSWSVPATSRSAADVRATDALRPDDHSHRRPQSLGAAGRASRTDLHRGSDAGRTAFRCPTRWGAQGTCACSTCCHICRIRGCRFSRRRRSSNTSRGMGAPTSYNVMQSSGFNPRTPSCSRCAMAYEAAASRSVSSSDSHSYRTGRCRRDGASAASARVVVFLPHCLSPMVCFVCSGITSRRETCQADISYWPIAIRCCVERIEESLTSIGMPFHVRPSSDYTVASKALTLLLEQVLRRDRRSAKRLPDFWPRLADSCARRRCCGRTSTAMARSTLSGEVIATTASRGLGVRSRLRAQAIRNPRAPATAVEAGNELGACGGRVLRCVHLRSARTSRRFADVRRIRAHRKGRTPSGRSGTRHGHERRHSCPSGRRYLRALRKGCAFVDGGARQPRAAFVTARSASSRAVAGTRVVALLKQLLDALACRGERAAASRTSAWQSTWRLLRQPVSRALDSGARTCGR